MDLAHIYKLAEQARTSHTALSEALHTAAFEMERLRSDLDSARHSYHATREELLTLQRQLVERDARPSDLKATQQALGKLHERFGIYPHPTTGTLGGDIRSLAEGLLKFCVAEELISAGRIKTQLQEITRALP